MLLDRLYCTAKDVASPSSFSVEMHSLMPLHKLRERDVVFNSPKHTLLMKVFCLLVVHGKYPDSGNEHIVEGVN